MQVGVFLSDRLKIHAAARPKVQLSAFRLLENRKTKRRNGNRTTSKDACAEQTLRRLWRMRIFVSKMSDADEFMKEYASSLENLAINSKPIINDLTILADENRSAAPGIVRTIEARLNQVCSTQRYGFHTSLSIHIMHFIYFACLRLLWDRRAPRNKSRLDFIRSYVCPPL